MEERKCWYCVKRIGKVYSKKMELILAIWVNTIDKLGYEIGQASLLTYSDYVIFKGFEMVIDIERIRYGLKWNVRTVKFYPKSHSQSQASNASEHQEIHKKDRRSKNQHNKNSIALDHQ